MPINTQFGLMSIGKDARMDVTQSDGSILNIAQLTDFDVKPITSQIQSKGLDGIDRFGVIPMGWQMTFSVDRQDRTLDDWWANYEEAYYAGNVIQNISITQTIQEGDGTISQWRFEGVAINLDDLGNWKADAYVKQKLTAKASKRVRVQ